MTRPTPFPRFRQPLTLWHTPYTVFGFLVIVFAVVSLVVK